MADTHLPAFWREHLIAVLGGHADAEKLRFLAAWAQSEGGTAKWNPLNSTFALPGSTTLSGNPDGVRNYSRPIWGVCATAMTITDPASGPLTYPKLLGHLQAAAGAYTAEQIVDDCATEISHWGSSVALIRRILATST